MTYLNLDTLAIPELHIQQLLILFHNFIHNKHLLPIAFANNYFILNSAIHLHNKKNRKT